MEERNEVENVDVEYLSEEELQEYNDSLVREVKDFVKRNIERNSNQLERMRADREFASGQQWTKEDKENRSDGRIEEALNVTENPISAVVNPISAKPFRTFVEVKPDFKELYGEKCELMNRLLSDVQDDFETGAANDSATYDEVCSGLGFAYATTIEKDGAVKVAYRTIEDATKVVWDANARSITMDDARQMAVIDLITKEEAEERFGTDIWGGKEPPKTTLADLGDDFIIPEGQVPLLTYFRVEGHSCEFHRLIGEQVVESDLIEGLSRVPVIAFVGEKKWINGEIAMCGLVRRLRPMQRRINYTNSQMMERLGQLPKMVAAGPAAAVDGYENEWADCNYSRTMYLRYKHRDKEGKEIPKPEFVNMSAKVDDLQSVIDGSIQLMQFASGVSPTGIVDQTINDDATALEVLFRTKSSQSNVSHYLKHAKESVKASGKVLAELINSVYGLGIPSGAYEIKVDGGCVELTEMEEERRVLLAIMQFVPDNMRVVFAIALLNTMDCKQAPLLAKMLVAMLPPELKELALGGDDIAKQMSQLTQQYQNLQAQYQNLQAQYQDLSVQAQELQLRTKSDLAIKQIDAQVQLQKQKMANDNAVLLKQMELQATAQQKQFDAQAESVSQDKEIVASAQADAVNAERDLNAELAKAEVNARLDIKKKQAEEAAKAAAMPEAVVPTAM